MSRILLLLKQHGIVHRDIKPANIIQTDAPTHTQAHTHTPRLHLVDLGCCKYENVGPRQTVIGTPGFTAPEAFSGHPCHASDIFSLGATTYTLLTHKRWIIGDTRCKRYLSHGVQSRTLQHALLGCLRVEASQRMSAEQLCELVDPQPSPRLLVRLWGRKHKSIWGACPSVLSARLIDISALFLLLCAASLSLADLPLFAHTPAHPHNAYTPPFPWWPTQPQLRAWSLSFLTLACVAISANLAWVLFRAVRSRKGQAGSPAPLPLRTHAQPQLQRARAGPEAQSAAEESEYVTVPRGADCDCGCAAESTSSSCSCSCSTSTSRASDEHERCPAEASPSMSPGGCVPRERAHAHASPSPSPSPSARTSPKDSPSGQQGASLSPRGSPVPPPVWHLSPFTYTHTHTRTHPPSHTALSILEGATPTPARTRTRTRTPRRRDLLAACLVLGWCYLTLVLLVYGKQALLTSQGGLFRVPAHPGTHGAHSGTDGSASPTPGRAQTSKWLARVRHTALQWMAQVDRHLLHQAERHTHKPHPSAEAHKRAAPGSGGDPLEEVVLSRLFWTTLFLPLLACACAAMYLVHRHRQSTQEHGAHAGHTTGGLVLASSLLFLLAVEFMALGWPSPWPHPLAHHFLFVPLLLFEGTVFREARVSGLSSLAVSWMPTALLALLCTLQRSGVVKWIPAGLLVVLTYPMCAVAIHTPIYLQNLLG